MKLADVDKVVNIKSVLKQIDAAITEAREFPGRDVIEKLYRYVSKEALITCLINLAIIEMSTLINDLQDLGIDLDDINALKQEYNIETTSRIA